MSNLSNYPCVTSGDDSKEDDAEEKVDIKGCEVSNLQKGSYNKPFSHRAAGGPTMMKEKEEKVKIIKVFILLSFTGKN